MSITFTTSETMAIIRKALKAQFPTGKFTVTSKVTGSSTFKAPPDDNGKTSTHACDGYADENGKVYTGVYGNSITIKTSWQDGPIESDVKAFLRQFRGNTHQGFTSENPSEYAVDSLVTVRKYSSQFIERAIQSFCAINDVSRGSIILTGSRDFFAFHPSYYLDIELSKFIHNCDYSELFSKQTQEEKNREYKQNAKYQDNARAERMREQAEINAQWARERQQEKERAEQAIKDEKEEKERAEYEYARQENIAREQEEYKKQWEMEQETQEEQDILAGKETYRERIERENFEVQLREDMERFVKTQATRLNTFKLEAEKARALFVAEQMANLENFEEKADIEKDHYESVLANNKQLFDNRAQAIRRDKLREYNLKQELKDASAKLAQEEIDRKENMKRAQEEIDRILREKEAKEQEEYKIDKDAVLASMDSARAWLNLSHYASNADVLRAYKDTLKTRSDGQGGFLGGIDAMFLAQVKDKALEPIRVRN